MTCILVGPRGSDFPTAMIGDGRRAGGPYEPSEVSLARFESFSWDAALNQFQATRSAGIRATLGGRFAAPRGPWRCRGGPEYLADQAIRLEVSPGLLDQVKGNKQLHSIGTQVGQLQGRYYAAPRRGEGREFAPTELRVVAGVLGACESHIAQLHALAAGAQEMVDDAHRAFGLTPPLRQFRVVADSDPTPSAPDDVLAELRGLRGEVGRLAAENASLTQHLEQLTAPPPPAAPPAAPTAETAAADAAETENASPPQPQPQPKHKGR